MNHSPESIKGTPATLENVLAQYVKYKDLKPRTAKQYQSLIDRCLADWKHLHIHEISNEMCLTRHAELTSTTSKRASSGGRAQANLVFRTLRALINFGNFFWSLEEKNPMAKFGRMGCWAEVKDRQDFIPAERLADWYEAIQQLPAVDRDIMLIWLLTAMRYMEAAELQWSDVNLETLVITLPGARVKNGRDHHIPMSTQVARILRRRYAKRSSEWVFDCGGRSYPRFRRPHKRIEQMLGIRCYPHALRKTFSTLGMTECGIQKFMISKALNHTPKDITERYIVVKPEALRPTFQTVADFIYGRFQIIKPRVRLTINHPQAS